MMSMQISELCMYMLTYITTTTTTTTTTTITTTTIIIVILSFCSYVEHWAFMQLSHFILCLFGRL
jgi:hypothetical protein